VGSLVGSKGVECRYNCLFDSGDNKMASMYDMFSLGWGRVVRLGNGGGGCWFGGRASEGVLWIITIKESHVEQMIVWTMLKSNCYRVSLTITSNYFAVDVWILQLHV